MELMLFRLLRLGFNSLRISKLLYIPFSLVHRIESELVAFIKQYTDRRSLPAGAIRNEDMFFCLKIPIMLKNSVTKLIYQSEYFKFSHQNQHL
jgi:hypothetical protein